MRCRARRWVRQARKSTAIPSAPRSPCAARPIPATGMVLDLGLLQQRMAEVQKMLDHKLLNKIEALGPPTLENLSRFVWERVQHAGRVTRVTIHRDSCGESCTYYGPQT